MSWQAPDSTPAVIDVEASGFGAGSYPIEIGFVTADGQTHCSLIKPVARWTHWDPVAEQVHQVSRETLMRHGRAVDEVAYWLNGYLRGQTVYSDGWGHDYSWLALLFDEAGSLPMFRLESLSSLLGEPEMAQWHPIRDKIQRGLRLERHRASNDARVLQQTLLRVRRGSDAPFRSAL